MDCESCEYDGFENEYCRTCAGEYFKQKCECADLRAEIAAWHKCIEEIAEAGNCLPSFVLVGVKKVLLYATLPLWLIMLLVGGLAWCWVDWLSKRAD